MKTLILAALIFLFAPSALGQAYKCLPPDVALDQKTTARITVRQALKNNKARCSRGKLVTPKNREIRFYRLKGCWGNPPFDYLEILEAQRKEIAALKKRYTLIEIACYSGDYPPPM